MKINRQFLFITGSILVVLVNFRLFHILGLPASKPSIAEQLSSGNMLKRKPIRAFVRQDVVLRKHRLWDDIQRIDSELQANRAEWQAIVDKYNENRHVPNELGIRSSIGEQIDEFNNSLSEEVKLQEIKGNIEGTADTSGWANHFTLDTDVKRRQLETQLSERLAQEKVRLDEAYEMYKDEILAKYTPMFLKNNLNKISGGSPLYDTQDLQATMKELLIEKRRELDASLAAIEKKARLELEDELRRYSDEQFALIQNSKIELDSVDSTTAESKEFPDPALLLESYNSVVAGLEGTGRQKNVIESFRQTFENRELELLKQRQKIIAAAEKDIKLIVQNYGKLNNYTVAIVSVPEQGMRDITDKVLKLL